VPTERFWCEDSPDAEFDIDISRAAMDIFGNSFFMRRTAILKIEPLPTTGAFGGISMKKLALFLVTVFCVTFISAPLLAHHGEANYDTEKMVSVKGTVTAFEFVNPHVQISIDAKNDKGETEKWVGEARSPAMLSRYGGWDRNTLKIGDVITFNGHRTKNGTFFMRLDKIVMSDGKELPNL
jgi:hypothetical protein